MIDRARLHQLARVAGPAAAAVAVWFGGRWLGAGDNSRFLAALAVALGGSTWMRAHRLSVPAPARAAVPASAAAGEEAALVRHRLRKGLADLRLAAHGGSRYTLPCYLVIGPQGAGKSALLAHSGLDAVSAPAAEEGTRACTMLVTRQAAFVDVAGSYVARRDLGPVDDAGWTALVDGLAAQRPLLPLNGIVLTLSPADLCLADGIERDDLAFGIRARIDALQQRYGSTLPVYVMLTKMDLTPGFTEYFDRLDTDLRDQAWGFTLPYDDGKGNTAAPLAGFDAEFARLLENLKQRQLDLLHTEGDRERAAMVLNFPAQVAALRPVLAEVLGKVFAEDEHGNRPLLRSVFLTSARQDLLTIDRLMPDLAGRFVLPPTVVLPPDLSEDESDQGWFIARPLRDAILAEAGLVCRRGDPYRPRVLARLAATVAALALCGLAASGLASTYQRHLTALEQVGVDIDRQLLSNHPDLGEQLRVLAFLTKVPAALPDPLGVNGALGDADAARRLGRTPPAAAAQLIDRAILPRLVPLLHQRLADPSLSRAQVASELTIFEMLADRTPPDAGKLTIWLDWAASRLLPGDDAERVAARRLLVEHTVYRLLTQRPPLPLSTQLAEYAAQRVGEGR